MEKKYTKALGVWELTDEIEIKPKGKDNRKLLKLVTSKEMKDDKNLFFDSFAEFMLRMIRRDNPLPEDSKGYEDQQEFVDLNIMNLFKDTLITFKYMTQKDLDDMVKESKGDLKNLIDGN